MYANAQPLEQRLEVKRTRTADSRVALEIYRQMLAQNWAVHFSTATATTVRFPMDAFNAVRHDAVTESLNLGLTEPEDEFLVLRSEASVDLPFRGRHGKLLVIRK